VTKLAILRTVFVILLIIFDSAINFTYVRSFIFVPVFDAVIVIILVPNSFVLYYCYFLQTCVGVSNIVTREPAKEG
jgi:hypothetical protein